MIVVFYIIMIVINYNSNYDRQHSLSICCAIYMTSKSGCWQCLLCCVAVTCNIRLSNAAELSAAPACGVAAGQVQVLTSGTSSLCCCCCRCRRDEARPPGAGGRPDPHRGVCHQGLHVQQDGVSHPAAAGAQGQAHHFVQRGAPHAVFQRKAANLAFVSVPNAYNACAPSSDSSQQGPTDQTIVHYTSNHAHKLDEAFY